MKMIDVLGTAAATLTTGCFVPQVARLWRTRNSDGISLVTFGAFSVGVALWGAYGVILGSWPIILSNAITLILSFAIIVLTLRFRRRA